VQVPAPGWHSPCRLLAHKTATERRMSARRVIPNHTTDAWRPAAPPSAVAGTMPPKRRRRIGRQKRRTKKSKANNTRPATVPSSTSTTLTAMMTAAMMATAVESRPSGRGIGITGNDPGHRHRHRGRLHARDAGHGRPDRGEGVDGQPPELEVVGGGVGSAAAPAAPAPCACCGRCRSCIALYKTHGAAAGCRPPLSRCCVPRAPRDAIPGGGGRHGHLNGLCGARLGPVCNAQILGRKWGRLCCGNT
jgi:hypothetical protein